MNQNELTSSILKLQAFSKLLLVYVNENDHSMALTTIDAMNGEVSKIYLGCVTGDRKKFMVTK